MHRRSGCECHDREQVRGNKRLDSTGIKRVDRPVHLTPQRVEARGYWPCASHCGGMRRAEQRRNGDDREVAFVHQTLRRGPANAQARKTPRTIADDDAGDLSSSRSTAGEHLLDAWEVLCAMLARAANDAHGY